MGRIVGIEAVTAVARHQAIERLKEAVSGAEGWIRDHTFLSDMAMSMSAEINGAALDRFLIALTRADLKIEPKIPDGLDRSGDIVILLSLTFVAGTGDLKQVVPADG